MHILQFNYSIYTYLCFLNFLAYKCHGKLLSPKLLVGVSGDGDGVGVDPSHLVFLKIPKNVLRFTPIILDGTPNPVPCP